MFKIIKKTLFLPAVFIAWIAVDNLFPGVPCVKSNPNVLCASPIAMIFAFLAFGTAVVYFFLFLLFLFRSIKRVFYLPKLSIN